ncbi:flagellar filament capping protein FliD [Herbivorax sp. ANBcel31]|uniref:flagellar filament capping protein FliD n=1 Tax=Herbivorax sp. ANBcel31 TaxID=3069754 RepID=UPI0027B48877|nr:flagellar filament capping protein FliD [Herbivorax sp. ANBcel31]MDQ2085090.1 flagellar filament capping protein FliD [Herbivorax sp. ANBcel31]
MPVHGMTGMDNNQLRFSGLASGIDTDHMISQMMRAEKMKVGRVEQDKQLLEWERDAYRDITNKLRGFSDEYFNLLKPETNFRSPSAFSSFDINSSNEAVATAVADSSAESGTHSIEVEALASGAKIEGASNITRNIIGSEAVDDFELSERSINVTLDGVTKTIDLENYSDINDMVDGINASLADAFGAGKIEVSSEEGRIEFDVLLNGSTLMLADGGNASGGLEKLGFAPEDNTSNRISLISGLDSIKNNFINSLDIDNPEENVVFTINDTVIDVGKSYEDANIRDVMNAINYSDAGVRMQYDSLNDKFNLTSTVEGAASSITFEDTSDENGLLKSLGIVDGTYSEGTDAEFTLNGVENMKRSSNEFTIDGVQFSLNGISTEPVTIDINNDVDAVVDNIKGFVESYNDILDETNGLINEKRDRDYRPLTREQREAMSDDEIEKWEEKAKSGLLNNDRLLSGMVNDMRRALFDNVEGSSISIFDVGITTGAYFERGKLNIDEEKLREALNNNFNEVVNLFTNTSQHSENDVAGDGEKMIERYNESGITQRIHNILDQNIRITRGSDGRKGELLERAGIVGDTTEFNNTIENEINRKDSTIERMIDRMHQREESYYQRFATMEKMLNQMQSQSEWLMQQLGI